MDAVMKKLGEYIDNDYDTIAVALVAVAIIIVVWMAATYLGDVP